MDDFTLIDTGNMSIGESFALAKKYSQLLSSGNEAITRKAVIHVLNKWESIPTETYPIWTDLIETLGFYPYIQKNYKTMHLASFSDEVRQQHFSSDYLSKIFLHKEQKRLSDYIFSGQNVIASAPTSFGKSLLIEEIIASKKYRNIVVIQPTLALLDETRIRLKKYGEYYKIIVRTSQSPSKEKGNLFLLTAERVMEYENLPVIDLLIIDEFYKLSLRRIDERADTLNNAFLKVVERNSTKFYLLGPNIDGISDGFAEKYNAIFYKSSFSLVDCNVVDMTDRFDGSKTKRSLDNEKSPVLFDLLYSLRNEQTLVYCSNPARARRFAREYLVYLKQRGVAPTMPDLPLTEWISINLSDKWSLAEQLRYGISIHDGSLQKHIGASIIDYFNKGLLKYIFCTSTIIEGVNTSAKNVVIFDGYKGSKSVDFFDYSNIKGRSGRLMEHYVGNVYNFISPPQKQSVVIDIPFFEQKPITDEILINLPKEDVHTEHYSRYNELNNIFPPLLDIIKKNGVSVNGQLSIYYALEKDVNTEQYENIAWSQMPGWKKINYILSLAENNIFKVDMHGIKSVGQLAFYLNQYRKTKNLMDIVQLLYVDKMKSVTPSTAEKNSGKYYDDAIEAAFHIYRQWFQFTVPKAFRVVDSIQRLVCERHKKRAGSYSYFVQQLENDFIPENLSILLEYGIPASAIRKISDRIPEGLSEDDAIEFIKANRDYYMSFLLQYERDKFDYSL